MSQVVYRATLPGVDAERATRIIFDSNVIGPAVDWRVGLRKMRTVPEHVVRELQWISELGARRRMAGSHLVLEPRYALMEKSREDGVVDGYALGLRLAAAEDVFGGLVRPDRVSAYFGRRGRALRPTQAVMQLDGADQYADNECLAYAILSLALAVRVAQRSQSPKVRLEALVTWGQDVRAAGARNSLLVMAAIDAMFASTEPPLLHVLKFGRMAKPGKALETAHNGAWDLQFVRALQESEAGLGQFVGHPRRSVLLTCDHDLARAIDSIGGVIAAQATDGRDVFGLAWQYEQHLTNKYRTDRRTMGELRRWVESMSWQSSVDAPLGNLGQENARLAALLERPSELV